MIIRENGSNITIFLLLIEDDFLLVERNSHFNL